MLGYTVGQKPSSASAMSVVCPYEAVYPYVAMWTTGALTDPMFLVRTLIQFGMHWSLRPQLLISSVCMEKIKYMYSLYYAFDQIPAGFFSAVVLSDVSVQTAQMYFDYRA